MADPKHRHARDAQIKKVDDHHPYGGVRSEPLKDVPPAVDDSKPHPRLKPPRDSHGHDKPHAEPPDKNQS